MKKNKVFIMATLFVVLLVVLSVCSNSSEGVTSQKSQSESDNMSQSTVDSSQSNDSDGTLPENSSSQREDNIKQDEGVSTDTTDGTKEDENIQVANTENKVTIIEERKTEYLEKLDNIQKELDALPEKKDSDKGVTNAMKNYYGISYEKYDKALNEIYTLLRDELSTGTMDELKAEQIKWIEQKEDTAKEERKKYEGGTFENVAYYISAYESTKERCYELVNDYMTD